MTAYDPVFVNGETSLPVKFLIYVAMPPTFYNCFLLSCIRVFVEYACFSLVKTNEKLYEEN